MPSTGAVYTETALVVVFLLVILLFALQVGLASVTQLRLRRLTDISARYAAAFSLTSDDQVETDTKNYAVQQAAKLGVTITTNDIAINMNKDYGAIGSWVEVTISKRTMAKVVRAVSRHRREAA